MNGPESLAAYNKAVALVKEGRYDEARAVELLPSDRAVIEKRIAQAMTRTSTNRADSK